MDTTGDGIVDGSWVGNPNLKPEQHNQLDFGIGQVTQNYNWSASVYFDKVENYILRDSSQNQTETASMNNSIYLNKDAKIFGLDFEGQIQFAQDWISGTTLSYIRGKNTTDDRNLSNIAPINGKVFAEYAQNEFMAGLRLNYALKQDDVNTEFNEITTPGFLTADIYSEIQLQKHTQLMAGVDNLFDRGYYSYLNRTDATSGATYKVYEPGMTAWLRVKTEF
jgi:iron complex outermembrane receptor protein